MFLCQSENNGDHRDGCELNSLPSGASGPIRGLGRVKAGVLAAPLLEISTHHCRPATDPGKSSQGSAACSVCHFLTCTHPSKNTCVVYACLHLVQRLKSLQREMFCFKAGFEYGQVHQPPPKDATEQDFKQHVRSKICSSLPCFLIPFA